MYEPVPRPLLEAPSSTQCRGLCSRHTLVGRVPHPTAFPTSQQPDAATCTHDTALVLLPPDLPAALLREFKKREEKSSEKESSDGMGGRCSFPPLPKKTRKRIETEEEEGNGRCC
ncbi:hypothetical protein PIB30_087615 [Stylosanthes scabra]|uniref:Uncharacterized protein n=1 Tax=Stylosanthes scabra TaxID=79078 RepID=A0ABU6TU76_9FABA|nr:hypothetical protein [Stylosanthes scabra]